MRLDDIEEICALKYRYFRHLDLKEFDELGALLTDDCAAAYDDGALSFEGRAAIVEFLGSSLSGAGIISEHHGHHPEITFTGPDAAVGTWYLEDRVLIPAADLEIAGTAFYEDVYRRDDGTWRIAATGYRRVFEEHRSFTTRALTSFRSRFDEA
jgi:ketosteroid isomerase-like protein